VASGVGSDCRPVIVSGNELLAAAHKAAVGAGLPTGIAEDVSQATVWLCRHEVDGVQAALAGLANADDASARLVPGNAIAFADARAAMHGPSALDLLVAGAAPDGVMLHDLDSPRLLVGLAGVAAGLHHMGFVIRDDRGAACTVSGEHLAGEFALDPTRVHVRIAAPQDATPEGEQASTGQIVVDEIMWTRLNEYAARTYVAATEQSRVSGAGAGLTDND